MQITPQQFTQTINDMFNMVADVEKFLPATLVNRIDTYVKPIKDFLTSDFASGLVVYLFNTFGSVKTPTNAELAASLKLYSEVHLAEKVDV